MRKRFARLVTQQQICYPLAVIMLDRILHTADHPHCKDPTCPCNEQQPLHTAPSYLHCSCQRCVYVRSVLGEHQQWEQRLDYQGQEDVEHRQ